LRFWVKAKKEKGAGLPKNKYRKAQGVVQNIEGAGHHSQTKQKRGGEEGEKKRRRKNGTQRSSDLTKRRSRRGLKRRSARKRWYASGNPIQLPGKTLKT